MNRHRMRILAAIAGIAAVGALVVGNLLAGDLDK